MAEQKKEEYGADFEKEVRRQLKLREKKRRFLVLFCSLLAVVSLGYFGYYQYMLNRTQKQSQQLSSLRENNSSGELIYRPKLLGSSESEPGEILKEYETLYNKNKKLIGWIKVDDTLIDYPVMQTVNNEYYLDHNFDQQFDKNGSIFLDYQCDAAKRSMNLIVYGHNMQSGKMFGNLHLYQKEDYYKKHPTIKFDTIYEKGTYQVMFVFRSKVYEETEIAFKYYQFIDAVSEEEFYSNMEQMREMSFYDTEVEATYGEQLLTLSTCDYNETNGRFVVVARRIE